MIAFFTRNELLMKRYIPLLSYFYVALCSVDVCAVELSDTFSVNGFGTLGVTKTSADSLGFRQNISTDNVTSGDWNLASRSLLGVQMNANWNTHWSSALQLVQEKRVENSFSDSLQLASITYMPTTEWALRFGRLSPRVYMLTDTRNVGYGYLWTHPPMEFYGQLQTNYNDGVEISYTKQFDDADMLRATLSGGRTGMQMSYPGYNFDADFGQAWALTLEYEDEAWQFRGSLSSVSNQNQWASLLRQSLDAYSVVLPVAASVSDALNTDGSQLWFYSLGMSYNDSQWTMQSEISRLDSSNEITSDTIAGYLSLGRHIGKFTPYVVYSRIHTISADYQLPADVSYYAQYDNQLNYLTTTSLAFLNSRFDQKGIAIGVRWDLNSHLTLKTQWDRKFISPDGNHLWWHIDGSNSSTEDVFTLNLDFVF